MDRYWDWKRWLKGLDESGQRVLEVGYQGHDALPWLELMPWARVTRVEGVDAMPSGPFDIVYLEAGPAPDRVWTALVNHGLLIINCADQQHAVRKVA